MNWRKMILFFLTHATFFGRCPTASNICAYLDVTALQAARASGRVFDGKSRKSRCAASCKALFIDVKNLKARHSHWPFATLSFSSCQQCSVPRNRRRSSIGMIIVNPKPYGRLGNRLASLLCK